VRRLIPNPAVKKDFAALLAGQSPDRRKLAQLVDLLERMMQLDPDKRISPKDALRHPFIKVGRVGCRLDGWMAALVQVAAGGWVADGRDGLKINSGWACCTPLRACLPPRSPAWLPAWLPSP